MKKVFYTALSLLTLFEIANVYFIMPMPGSQRLDSIGLAYFLYSWRWGFRIGLGALAALGFFGSRFAGRWQPIIAATALCIWAGITYMFNFEMTADRMFLQPKLVMKPATESQVDTGRLVIGVSINGAAGAYPIQFMAYHHQVRDTIGGQPVMVTYCNVCRSGRVFEPKVSGHQEVFRLVGMDHFNAMFEDASTRSWWRQENGEAVAGPLRGQFLPELFSEQMSLAQWLKMHPDSRIMQADSTYKEEYDAQKAFETGKKKSKLTGTDSLSWKDKSWVIGVSHQGHSKAFDWNELKNRQILNEELGKLPIVIVLANDGKSFAVFERPDGVIFSVRNDSLISGALRYDFAGHADGGGAADLKPVQAYQEFWHSWLSFHGAQ